MTPSNQSDHLMLTVLGKDSRPARYVLDGCEYKCDLAPIALLEQLPEPKRPNCVLAPCTPEAKEVIWPKPKEIPRDREHGKTLQVMRWMDGE